MDLRVALSCVAGLLLVSAPGRAEEAARVRVGGACMPPGTSLAEVLRILQAELAPAVVEPLDGAPRGEDGAATVGIDGCTDSPPGARVTVWKGGERVEGVVTLSDVAPRTRDRTFALAVAEALRGSAPEHAAVATAPGATSEESSQGVAGPVVLGPIAPVVSPPGALGEPPDPVTAPRSPRAVEWRAGLAGRLVGETTTPLVGLQLGITADRAGVGALGLWTEQRTSVGDATLTLGAAEGWYDAVQFNDVVRLRASAELGVAHAWGVPHSLARGSSASAFHVAACAGVAFVVPVGWSAFDGFLAAGAASSLTAEVDGRNTLGLGGWFLTASAALRFGGLP